MKSVQRGKHCGNIAQIMRKRKSSAKIETKRMQKQCGSSVKIIWKRCKNGNEKTRKVQRTKTICKFLNIINPCISHIFFASFLVTYGSRCLVAILAVSRCLKKSTKIYIYSLTSVENNHIKK